MSMKVLAKYSLILRRRAVNVSCGLDAVQRRQLGMLVSLRAASWPNAGAPGSRARTS